MVWTAARSLQRSQHATWWAPSGSPCSAKLLVRLCGSWVSGGRQAHGPGSTSWRRHIQCHFPLGQLDAWDRRKVFCTVKLEEHFRGAFWLRARKPAVTHKSSHSGNDSWQHSTQWRRLERLGRRTTGCSFRENFRVGIRRQRCALCRTTCSR